MRCLPHDTLLLVFQVDDFTLPALRDTAPLTANSGKGMMILEDSTGDRLITLVDNDRKPVGSTIGHWVRF